jgi:hypothetical protein
VPPLDIVTDMLIEQDDQLDDLSGEMVIFYDDIEIVEHRSDSYSSGSDSDSSSSTSNHYAQPKSSLTTPPPIPARTLKPLHLLNQQPSLSTVNHIYEFDKPIVRKRFDVNSVNDMLNRSEHHMPPSTSHRHPSARHFVGKLNHDDASLPSSNPSTSTNGQQRMSTKTLPARSSSAIDYDESHPTIIADTNALVQHIQNSLSRNSLHDKQIHGYLSSSSKDLRAFVSATYSPSNENMIVDDAEHDRHVQQRDQVDNRHDSMFKRQARLSKSFHNVSEYQPTDSYVTNESTLPSKSVDDRLDHITREQPKIKRIPLKLPSVVAGTSFSTLSTVDDHPRLLSMKWYTGHVSENSEISYEKASVNAGDLLHGYILTHGNDECRQLLTQLERSNDIRVQAALDDIRLRVSEFDGSKTASDLSGFMGYLERRLRSVNTNRTGTSIVSNSSTNGKRTTSNPDNDCPSVDAISIRSRTGSIGAQKEPTTGRQLGRQQLRASASNGHHPPAVPRRTSQSTSNQGIDNHSDQRSGNISFTFVD